MKNLVIVESPAKAKTIAKYLGKDFKVLSSVGHIRSIPTKAQKGVPPVDVKNDFATIYQVDPGKKKVVSELKAAAKAADEVWLATDEDREGESIAWHLTEVLGLDPAKTKRIVFHEITKDAITEAVKNPRTIDGQLVEAQQARQVLDRLVGFELSPVVWRKVPGGKSAGRVQSPAVRLVVEREAEIRNFESKDSFKLTAKLEASDHENLAAELTSKIPNLDKANQALEDLNDSQLTVADVAVRPGKRSPAAPFTTSTLQQTANSRLGFSSKQTMAAAQKLYQSGKITYMRTDSVNLSQAIIRSCKNYITEEFGAKYHKSRQFRTKSSSAQEAHEAIRPTDISLEKASANPTEQRLYQLIRNRTLASQMADAKLEKTTVKIDVSKAKWQLTASGEVILFDGFLKLDPPKKSADGFLPALKVGDILELISAEAKQTWQKPPARYTEGSLVKKLEELGIGRPSTYATILDTIQQRDYVVKGEKEGTPRQVLVLKLEKGKISQTEIEEKTGSDKGRLVPTAIGELINGFLGDHFKQVVDYGFTAKVETEFDQIAAGKLDKVSMLNDFYQPFHRLILDSKDIDRSSVSNQRELGVDPKTKLPVFARVGRFGPMLQLGETKSETKPRFSQLPEDTTIETVTLEQALEMFRLPRLLGEVTHPETKKALPIKANIGRFGPYLQVEKLFININGHDPLTIDLKTAEKFYHEKLEAEKKKQIAEWGEVKVLNGRFGPYVTNGKINVKIPSKTDPTKLTEQEAIDLLAKKRPGKKS